MRHEAWMRDILAIILVLGIFAVVIWAIASGKSVQDFALLLTPLVGLAGIAIGYFFGTGARSALESPRPDDPGPADRRTR